MDSEAPRGQFYGLGLVTYALALKFQALPRGTSRHLEAKFYGLGLGLWTCALALAWKVQALASRCLNAKFQAYRPRGALTPNFMAVALASGPVPWPWLRRSMPWPRGQIIWPWSWPRNLRLGPGLGLQSCIDKFWQHRQTHAR